MKSSLQSSSSESIHIPLSGSKMVVWDFDWSLADANSDVFIVEELNPSLAKEMCSSRSALRRAYPRWTDLMHELMRKLHAEHGIDELTLRETMRRLPVFDETVGAIRALDERGIPQLIVSDANDAFIRDVLEQRRLDRIFSAERVGHLLPDLFHATGKNGNDLDKTEDVDEDILGVLPIVTNPARFDEDGRLHVHPFHNRSVPHGCPRCPPNLCKGSILRMILRADGEQFGLEQGKDPYGHRLKVAYVGDGLGDWCAALQLRRGDFLFVRKDFALWRHLQREKQDVGVGHCTYVQEEEHSIRATVSPWRDGGELQRLLLAFGGIKNNDY